MSVPCDILTLIKFKGGAWTCCVCPSERHEDCSLAGTNHALAPSGRAKPMTSMLTRNWWAVLLRGIAAVLFGVLALRSPHLTLLFLVTLYGAYALTDGIFSVVAALSGIGQGQNWLWPLVTGLAGILVGIVTFAWPGLTALALVFFIAAWALVTGITEILAGLRLHNELANEWLLLLSGAVSVVLGGVLFIHPASGALAVVTVIGVFALIFGMLRIILAFELRNLQRQPAAPA